MSDENNEYQTGYKNPPKHGQFKKGQSGNPKGRPKNQVKSLADKFQIELSKKVAVMENGQKVTLTKADLMIKTAINKAAQGDRLMTKLLIPFLVNWEKEIEQPTKMQYIISWAKPDEE